MHNVVLALGGAWRVLIASLALGAGLPAIFALGIRASAHGASGEVVVQESGVTSPLPHLLGKTIGALCFITVIAGVALGITFIVASGFGKAISFAHVYPTIVSKH